MPLNFESVSHGEIPIGFFNIETDMFLINNYFIFAVDLCKAVKNWTSGPESIHTKLNLYIIGDQEKIGNLIGAIEGTFLTGFIGELYKKFPFPENSDDFKQNPEGHKNRKDVENIIKKYCGLEEIDINISSGTNTISIGEYQFNRDQFHEVIAYIWRGGMPRWKDDIRPVYVNEMMKAVMGSEHWLFRIEDDK